MESARPRAWSPAFMTGPTGPGPFSRSPRGTESGLQLSPGLHAEVISASNEKIERETFDGAAPDGGDLLHGRGRPVRARGGRCPLRLRTGAPSASDPADRLEPSGRAHDRGALERDPGRG